MVAPESEESVEHSVASAKSADSTAVTVFVNI